MTVSKALATLKRRLSPHLLAIEGVSGIGVRANILTVYLAQDAELIRQSVHGVLEHEAPKIEYRVIVTGTFEGKCDLASLPKPARRRR